MGIKYKAGSTKFQQIFKGRMYGEYSKGVFRYMEIGFLAVYFRKDGYGTKQNQMKNKEIFG